MTANLSEFCVFAHLRDWRARNDQENGSAIRPTQCASRESGQGARFGILRAVCWSDVEAARSSGSAVQKRDRQAAVNMRWEPILPGGRPSLQNWRTALSVVGSFDSNWFPPIRGSHSLFFTYGTPWYMYQIAGPSGTTCPKAGTRWNGKSVTYRE